MKYSVSMELSYMESFGKLAEEHFLATQNASSTTTGYGTYGIEVSNDPDVSARRVLNHLQSSSPWSFCARGRCQR